MQVHEDTLRELECSVEEAEAESARMQNELEEATQTIREAEHKIGVLEHRVEAMRQMQMDVPTQAEMSVASSSIGWTVVVENTGGRPTELGIWKCSELEHGEGLHLGTGPTVEQDVTSVTQPENPLSQESFLHDVADEPPTSPSPILTPPESFHDTPDRTRSSAQNRKRSCSVNDRVSDIEERIQELPGATAPLLPPSHYKALCSSMLLIFGLLKTMLPPCIRRVEAHGLSYGLKIVSAFKRICLLYTSPSPRDATLSRMPSSA